MKKRLFVTFGVVAILLASHTESLACSCIAPNPAQPLEKSVNDARNAAKAVFAGTVLGISHFPNGSAVAVKLSVDRTWKDPMPTDIILVTGGGGGDCGFPFKVGQSYLVYAHSRLRADPSQWELGTSICSRTTTLADAADDLKILGEGKAVVSVAPRWRVYSLAGTSTSVQSPAEFRRVRYYEGEHGIGDAWASKEEWPGFIAYVAHEPSKSRDYVLLAFPLTKQMRPLLKDDDDYLKWWIGGDDDSKPTSALSVDVNGLKGKEYVYTKEVSSDTYTRGRVLDSGAKVYILIFKSSTPEDLSSDDATRFLDSFRLQKKTRGAKKVIKRASQPTPPTPRT